MGSGGGGGSGQVSYPDYMQNQHFGVLINVNLDINAARAANPFTSAEAYDPTAMLVSVGSAVDYYYSKISVMDEFDDIASAESYAEDLFTYSNYARWNAALSSAASVLSDSSKTTFEGHVSAEATFLDSQLNKTWASARSEALADNSNYFVSFESATSAVTDVADSILTDTYIEQAVSAYATIVMDQLDNEVLPGFRSGMRDIGAVQTTAFALGEADIYSRAQKDINKFEADLRTKLADQRIQFIHDGITEYLNNKERRVQHVNESTGVILENNSARGNRIIWAVDKLLELQSVLNSRRDSATSDILKLQGVQDERIDRAAQQILSHLHFITEARRVYLQAQTNYGTLSAEQSIDKLETELAIAQGDAMWDLNLWQFANNAMGSITGGVVPTGGVQRVSRVRGAVSGALTGAGIGTEISAGYGTAIGAVLGGVGGYLAAGS